MNIGEQEVAEGLFQDGQLIIFFLEVDLEKSFTIGLSKEIFVDSIGERVFFTLQEKQHSFEDKHSFFFAEDSTVQFQIGY